MSVASLRFMRRLNRRLERQRAPLHELEPERAPDVQAIEAADFVTGGEADFARAANARGIVIATWRAGLEEPHAEFIARAKRGARAQNAARLVIGGVPDLSSCQAAPSAIRPAPRGAVAMPDGALHAGQIAALRVIQAHRFVALRAGRRFGKSSLAAALAADVALLGGIAGLFAPIYKLASPLFDALAATLAPQIATSNRSLGELRLIGGGGADVWNLERSRAGRGRRYNLVVLDEAAYSGPELTGTWSASIRPTLTDTQGAAIIASTPSGIQEDNFFYLACHEKQTYGFAEFVAKTIDNPFIPPAEIEMLRNQHNPLVFAQEFEAQFVNLAGVGLFDVAAMLDKGEPWETPERFDTVFATLDSGVRGGQEHDASAVIYLGVNMYLLPHGLFVLDWEAVELGAGDLELWFAGIGRRLEEYAEKTRVGSQGVHVERAGLGEMLLAKADALGVLAQEIPPDLVTRGKDLRALAAERFINGGSVKLTRPACDRVSRLKTVTRNHLLAQVAGFRIADREAWRRSDDLVDALVYATLLAFAVD
jgi:hypothetical protein